MSWVAVAGTVVSAGVGAYTASQNSKAQKEGQAAQAEAASKTKGYKPVTSDLKKAEKSYLSNYVDAGHQQNAKYITDTTNQYNVDQAQKYYTQIQPYFQKLQGQIGKNALSFAKGELPEDTVQAIGRASAQRGIEGGYGFGSQGAKQGMLGNLNLRNLGLTSLDLTKYGTNLGMQANQSAKALSPNLMGLQDNFYSPAQALQNQWQNQQVQNQGAISNTGLQNQMLQSGANQATEAARTSAAQNSAYAQQIGGAVTGVGNIISDYYKTNSTAPAATASYTGGVSNLSDRPSGFANLA